MWPVWVFSGEDLEERDEVPCCMGQGVPWTRHQRSGTGQVQDQPPGKTNTLLKQMCGIFRRQQVVLDLHV